MEGRVDILGPVHLGFVFLEMRGDGAGCFNGIHAGLHVTHMGGATRNRDPGPNHAHFRAIHGGQTRPWFGDDHGIRARQGEHRGKRAIAGAFFFND